VEAKVGVNVDKDGVKVVGTVEVPTSIGVGKGGIEGSAGSSSAQASLGADGLKTSAGNSTGDKVKVDLGAAKVSVNKSGVMSISVSRGNAYGQINFDSKGFADSSRIIDETTPSPLPNVPQ
jgi:hypothetical protein